MQFFLFSSNSFLRVHCWIKTFGKSLEINENISKKLSYTAGTHHSKGWWILHQSHDSLSNLSGSHRSYGIHRLPWASRCKSKRYLSHTAPPPPCHDTFPFPLNLVLTLFVLSPQGAEGIRGLKGGKGEKVNTSSPSSAWLTDVIPLKMDPSLLQFPLKWGFLEIQQVGKNSLRADQAGS